MFNLPKFVLPVTSKSNVESEEKQGSSKESDVAGLIQSAIKYISNHKAKLTLQVEMLD